jgi:hypothetical protein
MASQSRNSTSTVGLFLSFSQDGDVRAIELGPEGKLFPGVLALRWTDVRDRPDRRKELAVLQRGQG